MKSTNSILLSSVLLLALLALTACSAPPPAPTIAAATAVAAVPTATTLPTDTPAPAPTETLDPAVALERAIGKTTSAGSYRFEFKTTVKGAEGKETVRFDIADEHGESGFHITSRALPLWFMGGLAIPGPDPFELLVANGEGYIKYPLTNGDANAAAWSAVPETTTMDKSAEFARILLPRVKEGQRIVNETRDGAACETYSMPKSAALDFVVLISSSPLGVSQPGTEQFEVLEEKVYLCSGYLSQIDVLVSTRDRTLKTTDLNAHLRYYDFEKPVVLSTPQNIMLTATPTATATRTSTFTPAPTRTATATRVRATLPPPPTSTPAGPKYPAPALQAPSNGFGYNCQNDFLLSWTWSGPPLQGNEWFEIQFTVKDQNAWYSVAWTKEIQWVLHPDKGEGSNHGVALLAPGSAAPSRSAASAPILARNDRLAPSALSAATGMNDQQGNSADVFYPARPPCSAPWLQSAGTYEWKVRVVSGVQGSGKVDAVLSPDSEIRVFSYAGPQTRP